MSGGNFPESLKNIPMCLQLKLILHAKICSFVYLEDNCHFDIIFNHPMRDHHVNHMPVWVICKEGHISYMYLILRYLVSGIALISV